MRKLILYTFLTLFGTSIGLVLLEVIVRIALPPPQVISFSPTLPASTTDNIDSSLNNDTVILKERLDEQGGIFIHTPNGIRLRPNTQAVIKDHYLCRCTTEIRTNSLGYRGPEIGEKTKTRVLFLGDSITLADYIPEEKTWVRLVEQLSASTFLPLETINAGVWAIGLANEISILFESGLSTDPDVVVIGFYLNDIDPSPGIEIIRTPEYLEGSSLAHYFYLALSTVRSKIIKEDYSRITNKTRSIWQAETRKKFPPGKGHPPTSKAGFNRAINDLFFDWGSAWSDGAWEHMYPFFVEFKRQSEIHDFTPLVMIFPVADQVFADFLYDYPQQKLKAIADDLDITMLDLLSPLRKEHNKIVTAPTYDPKKALFYDWCHHTPYGNELIAGWVLSFLQEKLK